MPGLILSLNILCLLFHFSTQQCLEEFTDQGIKVKWEKSLPGHNIKSNPLCYNDEHLITRNCIGTEWDPPASEVDPCLQVVNYYNQSTCPPGFDKISKNNNDYCYQISEPSVWNYPCLKSGGASLITDLSNDDVFSLLNSLSAKNVSRFFWLPAKRIKFLSPVVWNIPGPKWSHSIESNNILNIRTSILKNCLLLDIERQNVITETCTEIYPSLCFYINSIHYPAKCPDKYHAVRYMPDEGICLGIEEAPTNLTFGAFIENKCSTPMGDMESNELTRFIFKKIAEIHNLPDNVWCWFGSSYMNRIEPIDFNRTLTELDYELSKMYVSINNIGTLSLINSDSKTSLPCMACLTEVTYEKTELIFEYNDKEKVMYLTVYYPSGLWKYDQNDRGIQCFSDAKGFVRVIDVRDLPFIELKSEKNINDEYDNVDKIVYAINLITDRAAQYWCEGHTKNFSLISTDKIVVNPQGNEVHVFSLVLKVYVSSEDVQNMLDEIKITLCSNITYIFDAKKVLLMEYLEYSSNYLMVLLHLDIIIENVYKDNAKNILSTYNNIESLAQNELPKYNYTFVNISSSMYCLPTTSVDNLNILDWELTKIGHIAAPKQFCLQENGLPVKRLCNGSYLLGSFWGNVEGICDKNYQPSRTTTFLYNFVKGQVLENETTSFLTDGLGFVLGDTKIIIPADIYYLSISLQHILSIAQINETSIDMGNIDNLAWVVDRLMILDNEYLRLAQTLNSTNVILDSIGNIIELLVHYNTRRNFRGYTESIITGYELATQPQFILQISHPRKNNISGVAIIKSSNTDKFTDMEIRPLFANTSLDEVLSIQNLEIATWLPDNVLNSLRKNNSDNETENDNDLHVIITVFHNDAIFQELDINKYIVNSRIVGVSIPGFVSNLVKPMPLIYRDIIPAHRDKLCGYWDFQAHAAGSVPGHWANSGCYLKKTKNNLTTCECYHLTHFGQLLDIGRDRNRSENSYMIKHSKSLNIISLVGSFLSLLGIVGIWITASVFHNWRKKAGTKVLLHLSASIALPLLFMIVFNLDNTIFEERDGIYKISNQLKVVCISLGAMLHYSVLASFMWMLITGVLQFVRYVRVLGCYRPSRFMIKFTLIGWGIPIIPVIFVLVLNKENYVPDLILAQESKHSICYPSGFYLIVSVIVPICIILLINVTLFISVICAISRGPDGKMRNADVDLIGAQLRLSIFLFFLLGLTWFFGIFSFSNNLIWSYLFCLTSTMQGFVLFVYFIICDSQTRNLWVTLMKPQFRNSSSRESITSISSG